MPSISPVLAIHLGAALAALALGPFALWARRSGHQRPRLHRAFGYAWVTMMLVAATSALFIRSHGSFSFAGFSPIHGLVPVVYLSLFGAFYALYRGQVARHRKTMVQLYVGACLVAGAFTLLPGRLLGRLVWGQWLGWV